MVADPCHQKHEEDEERTHLDGIRLNQNVIDKFKVFHLVYHPHLPRPLDDQNDNVIRILAFSVEDHPPYLRRRVWILVVASGPSYQTVGGGSEGGYSSSQ